MPSETFRVCYFGTYDESYPRNRITIDGLRANGVEVLVCNEPLWTGTEEKAEKASGGWMDAAFLLRVLVVYLRLARKELALPHYDVMLVGYPGQFDTYLARLLSWRRRVPLVLNVLMSLHLITVERGLDARSRLTNRLIYWAERGACLLADLLILDTAAYVDYFCEKYGLSCDKFRLVPLGADERMHFPVEGAASPDGQFKVVYYGSYLPLHGVEHMIRAADRLRDHPDIHFEMIGHGPAKKTAQTLAEHLHLENVTFTNWIQKSELLDYVADAQVCLGVFGTTQQSICTVQNKIWEGLAMAKPVITGDAQAVRDVLTPGEHVLVCERADSEALAEAILRTYASPELREHLSRNGHRIIQERYTVNETGRRFKIHLLELLSSRGNDYRSPDYETHNRHSLSE